MSNNIFYDIKQCQNVTIFSVQANNDIYSIYSMIIPTYQLCVYRACNLCTAFGVQSTKFGVVSMQLYYHFYYNY